ncbi:hypothetical protein CH373_02105 [Leptospira perolatii]|uniref:Acyltransferase 3 domain-containing protein n=1 Tax=Leptospira perolatii TaxID=2023191 RepID=A0A2M9ZSF3_9LEPT|nr:acyltransferase [Leptospira perolatii]PJZ71319.1 hypothetical protein CH360_02105 [Leptospira perolatii]PJZ74853.1 hypothetical protein CH373_02105 [Leptospira perolatii]
MHTVTKRTFLQGLFEYVFSPFLKKQGELESLNGLRAFAILFVIVYHLWTLLGQFATETPVLIKNILVNLNSGVDLFFVLSGYLIYGGFLRSLEKNRQLSIRKFFIDRTLRIFPAYYFSLIVLFFYYQNQSVKLHSVANPNPGEIELLYRIMMNLKYSFGDFFYFSNYTPFRLSIVGWSLSIEEQFYLILPFLSGYFLFTVSQKMRIGFLFLLYFIALGFRFFYEAQNSGLDPLIYTHCRMDSLVSGMLVAELISSRNRSGSQFALDKKVSAILIFLSIALLLLGHSFDLENWFRRTLGISCFNLGYAGILLLALDSNSLCAWIFNQPILRPIARLSYTMYLWNLILAGWAVSHILKGTRTIGPGQIVWACVMGLASSFLFSWLLFLIVEKPFLLWKDKLSIVEMDSRKSA